MNVPELKRLAEQYRTDPSIIFQMPAVIEEQPCGTAYCIAGQVCVNHQYKLCVYKATGGMAAKPGKAKVNAIELAAEILELDDYQLRRLFFKYEWPERFRNQPDTPALAAERIQHFIATKGRE